jgi:hypothetical protein
MRDSGLKDVLREVMHFLLSQPAQLQFRVCFSVEAFGR